jgi:DNA polymerase-1
MDAAPHIHPATLAGRPRLLLVDGTSVVRRIYEKVASVQAGKSAEKGQDSPELADGALKSSWGSFLRGLREHEPTHFLAAFDHGGQTWRHRVYPNYKADRKPMARCLAEALPGFLERMNNAGMRTLRVPDVEADDTIATLALKAVARGFEVILAASDKDMYKLLESGVKVYDHFQSEWRDADWVRNRFGVSPSQMTDYLALMGDETDGIPGIDGVGEKTAAKLLLEHGDLESVLAATDIKGKVGERLRDGAGVARLSRALAALKTDVELGITPRDLRIPATLLAHVQTMPVPAIMRTTPSADAVAQHIEKMHMVVGEAREVPDAAPAARRMRM